MIEQPQFAHGDRVMLGDPHNQHAMATESVDGPLDGTFVYFALVNGQTETSGPYAEVEAE